MSERESANKLLILKTARLMAKEKGWEAVSIRKIADQIQYKAPIVYEFFEGKEDLIAQVLEDGFSDLRKKILKAWEDQGKSKLSLQSIALEYWKYAHKNPEIYGAMNLFSSLKKTHSGIALQTESFCHEVSIMMSEWALQHSIKDFDSKASTDILWAQLHGLVSLGLSGQLGSSKKVESLIIRSVSLLEKGFRQE